jgi:hypothetical protein
MNGGPAILSLRLGFCAGPQFITLFYTPALRLLLVRHRWQHNIDRLMPSALHTWSSLLTDTICLSEVLLKTAGRKVQQAMAANLSMTNPSSLSQETYRSALTSHDCRRHSTRSHRTWWEHFISVLGWYPWRCHRCGTRYYIRRRGVRSHNV